MKRQRVYADTSVFGGCFDELSAEIVRLRDACVEAGVVASSSLLDAEYIASASVADVDVIVSWNFRHIVYLDKIRAYHTVNLICGYRAIPMHTPREVIAV